MKNIFNRTSTKTALFLGALTVTAAFGAGAAQAAPFDRSPIELRGNGFRPTDRQVFTGTVIKERENNLFNMKYNGKTYNVYTVRRTSRRLNAGDLVRVTGKRVGDNDIRQARVEILRNR